MAAQQQAAADAEYERMQAELERIAKLKQAYQEFQISLMPTNQGQQATWSMISERWGIKSGLPTGAQAKGIIGMLASDTGLVGRMESMGEAAAGPITS